LRSRSRTFVDLLHRDYTVLRWADEKLGFRRLSVHPGFVARVLPLRTRRSLSPLSEGVPGEGDEKLGLHRLSVHPGFVARVSPPRTRRSLSPPFGGGARGGVGSRLGNRVGPLGPCKIRLRTVSKHTANCPAHPPWPPLRKGGKGLGRSHCRSIARNNNARLETGPPTRSTPSFHHPTLPPLRRLGKTAQRNRDEREASARPAFHHPRRLHVHERAVTTAWSHVNARDRLRLGDRVPLGLGHSI